MRPVVLPLSFLLAHLLAACGPGPEPGPDGVDRDQEEPVDDGMCAGGPTPAGGDAAPVIGEDGWAFASGDPVAVSADADWDLSARTAVAADGSVWIAWYAWERGGIVFRAQHLDPDGAPAFGEDGLLVSDHPQATWVMDFALAATADGDAVVAFADERTGRRDLHAYRVGVDGALPWGADGVSLSAGGGGDAGPPSVTLLDDGDVAIAWAYYQAERAAVQVARLGGDGEARWAAPLELPCEAGFCASPVAVPLDGTDVAVLWMESAEFMTDDRAVRARRLDIDGCPVWGADPVLSGADFIPYYQDPAVVATPDGLWAAWPAIDGRATVSVQRLDDDGTVGFGGEPVRASPGRDADQFDPTLAWDAVDEELVLAWTETDADQSEWGLVAQRIDAAGERGWGGAGLTIVPRGEANVFAAGVRTWGDRALVFHVGDGVHAAILDDDAVVETLALAAGAGPHHGKVSPTSPSGRWAASWIAAGESDEGDVYVSLVGEAGGVGVDGAGAQ